MKVLMIMRNWFVFLAILAIVILPFWMWRPLGWHLPERGTMTGLQVVLFSLAFAFTWVEVLKWWKQIRPFNCLKCLTGWTALILAVLFHVQFWWIYPFVGVAVGAVFGAIKMRWL